MGWMVGFGTGCRAAGISEAVSVMHPGGGQDSAAQIPPHAGFVPGGEGKSAAFEKPLRSSGVGRFKGNL
jgi:hypothetical protein